MIQARAVCLSFGNQTVFDDISFITDRHDRVGLVGRNGSGKTTLLKVILEPTLLNGGTITIQKNAKIAYMPQEVVLQSSLSVLDETLTAFPVFAALQQQLDQLEKRNQQEDPSVVERYAALQDQMGLLSPEVIKARVKKVLAGLGFPLEQFYQPVDHLSVGWKMRIVLAKLLLQEADFYLFDEPTNHLDLESKEWFLDFLKKSDFGFILICHERYFLDELCNKIMELERNAMTYYTGNYSQYVVQKEHDLTVLESAYVQQQKEIRQKQVIIERFRASQRARMALSMEKALEKIERIELPPSPKHIAFQLPDVVQSGKEVIRVSKVAQCFGTKAIFQDVSFIVNRAQKVALIGPNGVGKTTLFNLIAGICPLQQGTISFGHNVHHVIFAQDQNKVLSRELSVLETIKQLCPKVSEQKIRNYLGAFLFSGDDVIKKVAVLSGGEKNRVGMIGVLLQNANLLLLDEPTNHLDIPSKELLLKALQDFKGTLLFVSHDRDFVNQLATHIIELTPQGAYAYQGNYNEYVYQKQASMTPSVDLKTPVTTKSNQRRTAHDDRSKLHKKLKHHEEKIARLEERIHLVNLSFADIVYGTPEFTLAVNKLQMLQEELQKEQQQWEQLVATPD